MSDPDTRSAWNWMAIWHYFVLSLCGATIAAYSMAPRVLSELAKTKDPQAEAIVARIREGIELTTNVTSFASLAAIILSGFLIPKCYGPVRKK